MRWTEAQLAAYRQRMAGGRNEGQGAAQGDTHRRGNLCNALPAAQLDHVADVPRRKGDVQELPANHGRVQRGSGTTAVKSAIERRGVPVVPGGIALSLKTAMEGE